jgi:hypothetical protein
MKITTRNNETGQLWMRDFNNTVRPLNESLSSIYLKYEKEQTLFFTELTSNNIKRFDVFYDSIFIQTNQGYIFEKYKLKNSEIVPYDKILNYNPNISNLDLDYWFDESEQIIYIFEFSDTGIYISPNPVYGLIQIAFNFKSFDTKTNVISNLLSERFNLWIYKPKGLSISNGTKGNPKLSYNPETKTFNVSFSIKNDDYDSFGLISINFKKNKILEINTAIPFGEVMPLNFVPSFNQDYPFFECYDYNENENKFISGEAGYSTFYVNFGSLTGQAGINYNSYAVPDRFDIYWNGNFYTTNYVGDSKYDQDLINLGIPLTAINTDPYGNSSKGTLSFLKTAKSPTYAIVRVIGPLGGTGWEISFNCVQEPITVTPTPTPTPTPTRNLTPTPTPTKFYTPTPTKTPQPSPYLKAIYVAFDPQT